LIEKVSSWPQELCHELEVSLETDVANACIHFDRRNLIERISFVDGPDGGSALFIAVVELGTNHSRKLTNV
jgi:hypothetical protein